MPSPSAPYDDQNVFARILRGELPCHRVHEDAHTLAFMDIMPRCDGHCLVIPKAPVRNVLDADDATLAQVYSTVARLSRAAMTAFDADGLTIQQFNEQAGGQVVFHLHVHILPRREGVALRPHTGQMADAALLAGQARRLAEVLAGIGGAGPWRS